jgi:hypothetical protein
VHDVSGVGSAVVFSLLVVLTDFLAHLFYYHWRRSEWNS